MRSLLSLLSLFLLSACVSLPQYPGGQRISVPGVSFVPPAGKQWSMMMRSTYQTVLASTGKDQNETFIVATQIFQISNVGSKEDFLKRVKEQRAAEPQTGRFETTKNREFLDNERTETCVRHIAASKDYGAKRGADFTIYETYGMNCIHPNNPEIGVFVELSKKAPQDMTSEDFEILGKDLLRSVEFTKFR
jgi:hypothetical protein